MSKNTQKTQIILDTNFFMIPWQFKVDIISELDKLLGKYEIILLKTIKKEIEMIISSKNNKNTKKIKGKDKLAAKFALSLIENLKKQNKLIEIDDKKIIQTLTKETNIKNPNGDIILTTYILTNQAKSLNNLKNPQIKLFLKEIQNITQNHQKLTSTKKKDLKTKANAIFKSDLFKVPLNLNNIYLNKKELYIATQDKTLRKALKIINIPIIELKQKKYLIKLE